MINILAKLAIIGLFTSLFIPLVSAQLRLFQDHMPGTTFDNSKQVYPQSYKKQEAKLCEAQMLKAAAKYGIPVSILYAVGLTETGQKNSLQAYALNIEGRPVFAKNLAQALRIFQKAKLAGAILIDVGCMQINVHYHGKEFSSVSAMFDPALNVDYAARFLKQLYKREKSWTMAVARYHAGPDNNPAQKKYICLVIKNLIAVGFGSWTPESKNFCFS